MGITNLTNRKSANTTPNKCCHICRHTANLESRSDPTQASRNETLTIIANKLIVKTNVVQKLESFTSLTENYI